MRKRHSTRRATSLLVLLAMLIVSVAALLPTVASADPVGDHASDIQDFSYQTLSSANPNDDDTDLRFMFTVGSLDYDAVGFVFSTSDSAPTAGGKNTYSTEIVYRTITANGDEIPAPTDRYWVAVKLSDILLSDFETTIYVRPFIKDGANYSYVDAASLTVLKALTLDKVVAGEGSIYNSNNPGEHPYRAVNSYRFDKQISAIRGENHFCPTDSDNDGNDLWFEYSLLYNDTYNNYNSNNCASETKVFGFVLGDYSDHSEFYYLYGQDFANRVGDDNDKKAPDCKFRGHFDYSTYLEGCTPDENCADDLTSEGNYLFGDLVGRYAAGWSGGRTDSPYIKDDNRAKGGNGWHRLGFRFHQEVASVEGDTVTYSGYSELYINGTLVWRVQSNMTKLESKDLLLWEARTTAADGWTEYNGLYYRDNDTMRVQNRMDSVNKSTNAVYVGVADICWTCGNGFAHPVSAVNTPASRTLILNDQGNDNPADDVTTSSAIWYVYDNN